MPASGQPSPRGDEDELYRRYNDALLRAVRDLIKGSPQLIEDACQNAWAILLRHQPDRRSLFAWLRVVAVREAYRLSRAERRDRRLDNLGDVALITETVALEQPLEARHALRLLGELPDRQRRDLALFVAGFSYREIAEITGGRTFTNVNKHLVKARKRVRRAQLGADEGANS